jgi:L-lactate dehydrogenase (cytochrome)
VKRQVPRVADVLPYLRRPSNAESGRLARCGSVWDLRALARRRVPRAVFNYVDGAAMDESSLRRARNAFQRLEFTPRVLADVTTVDLTSTMLGRPTPLPFALAPTGFTRLMHHVGEPAVARAARDAGIPYALSTLGTTDVETLTRSVPDARIWFQLYVNRDRRAAEDLMARATEAGCDTLILTVDAPVGGIRGREVRDGLSIPPRLSPSTVLDMARYPRWWANLLTTEPLTFASLTSTDGTVGDLLSRAFDPSLTYADIPWIRANWPGRLMVKGVQSLPDAERCADVGVEAIVLSNHGGRQLDRANIPLELLPNVARRVGDRTEVYLDGGIMRGTDIVGALALGAHGVLIGRAYLYGLMAAGETGVRRVIDMLTKEVAVSMQLLGVTSVDDLRDVEVRLRPHV